MIVYELNEVPKRIFTFYADAFPSSTFAYLLKHSALFATRAPDLGHLSPWITWPTMHRGVSNVDHEISDLGQDLAQVNKEFPAIQNLLADNGVRVGVFGSLHSYPLPKNLDNYAFYVPDTFAAGEECFPEKLSHFQAFNLSMVSANGRNVSKGIAVKDAKKFLLNARQLGLTANTVLKLTKQVASEQVNKDRVVRRRTSQMEIAFDLYMRQIKESKPEISFFFTNHLASSLHRYWPTIFPGDYEDGKFEKSWRERWAGEIPHAVKVANFQLSKLVSHCIENDEELVVCSSMGQAAVEDSFKVESQVLITNIRKLLRYIGISDDEWEPRLSMAPIVMVKPLSDNFIDKIKRLHRISVNGTRIDYQVTSSNEVRFATELYNQEELVVIDGNTLIDGRQIGIENIDLQDASGAYAYHIPEGTLLRFDPRSLKSNTPQTVWTEVSTLDFAPALLAKFNINAPSYMKGDKLFINYRP